MTWQESEGKVLYYPDTVIITSTALIVRIVLWEHSHCAHADTLTVKSIPRGFWGNKLITINEIEFNTESKCI